MGESSACLRRSFSQLSPTSSENKKVSNPLQRALTTSVSFGRFMSESLDWEKWSAFTHNRYLEELEQYSKPGSVAEKKAYFEAHFKRRRDAALQNEQQNEAATNAVRDNSSSNSDLNLIDGYTVIENTTDEEVQSNGPIFLVDQNDSYDASIENQKVTESPVVMESRPVELTTKHLENDEHIGVIASKNEAMAIKLSTNPLIIRPSRIGKSATIQASEKIAVKSSYKRRSKTTSLHMSINFASSSEKATTQDRPKIAKSRLVTAPTKKHKSGMVPQTSTRASVNGIYNRHSEAPPAENRRTVRPQCDSNSVRRTADFKVQSQFSNYSKSSNTFEGKSRLPTASSPFSFKSEERAAKRKEKLEQKFKSKEAEKHERHEKSQVKASTDFKNLRISTVSKASKNAEVPQKVELLSNLNKKTPTVRPSYPKAEQKASFKVQENDSRPPWGLSAKRREGLKDVTGKNRHPSGKCFPQKNNENASPNIRV